MQQLYKNTHIFMAPLPEMPVTTFFYKFAFLSLISPWMLNNIRLFLLIPSFFSSSYLYLKQSYLLLTWLYYLTFTQRFTLNTPTSVKNVYCRFFVAPLVKQKYTLLKAPMAHKTYSKEQFTHFYYNIYFWFKFSLLSLISSANAALLFVLLTKACFPYFESNLFFLNYFYISFFYKDQLFFTY